MNALYQSFLSLARCYKGDKSDLTQAISAYQNYGDEVALSYAAVKVFPYINKYRAEVVRVFGEAELEESFIHALTYAAKKYNPNRFAKFETFFNWCLNSTVKQLYVSSNSKRSCSNYGTTNIDDLEFCLESTQCSPEEGANVSFLLDLFAEGSDERRIMKLLLDFADIKPEEVCFELAFVKRPGAKKENNTVLVNAEELKEALMAHGTPAKALKNMGLLADTHRWQEAMDVIRTVLAPHKEALMY